MPDFKTIASSMYCLVNSWNVESEILPVQSAALGEWPLALPSRCHWDTDFDGILTSDDNRLSKGQMVHFSSFHPLNFDSSIFHLQNALQHISSSMTANLLTLNSSKTEFLLIGLKKPTCQNTQLFTWNLPLCLKSWLYLWRTSDLLWPNYISSQSPLLLHSPTSLHPGLPRFVNCLYHCYLYRTLQTWLL